MKWAIIKHKENAYYIWITFLTFVYFRYGNNGAATMTLGRRGHYASVRSAARTTDTDLPLLGPNQGQYATLSKGCKTLESSDFY